MHNTLKNTPKNSGIADPPAAIGVLGGMGPQAGIDLASKIVEETLASLDQDHIPTVMYSHPGVPDRTEFLFDQTKLNPALSIETGFLILERAGAVVAGMACNTAHSPPIFDRVIQLLCEKNSNLTVLHLISETVRSVVEGMPGASKVGVLGTKGTLKMRLYDDRFKKVGIECVQPRDLDALDAAIFDSVVGIKSCSSPVSAQARDWTLAAIHDVIEQGAEAVILGCTELPLAVPENRIDGIMLIDPSQILARALIHHIAPDRLRALRVQD